MVVHQYRYHDPAQCSIWSRQRNRGGRRHQPTETRWLGDGTHDAGRGWTFRREAPTPWCRRNRRRCRCGSWVTSVSPASHLRDGSRCRTFCLSLHMDNGPDDHETQEKRQCPMAHANSVDQLCSTNPSLRIQLCVPRLAQIGVHVKAGEIRYQRPKMGPFRVFCGSTQELLE